MFAAPAPTEVAGVLMLVELVKDVARAVVVSKLRNNRTMIGDALFIPVQLRDGKMPSNAMIKFTHV